MAVRRGETAPCPNTVREYHQSLGAKIFSPVWDKDGHTTDYVYKIYVLRKTDVLKANRDSKVIDSNGSREKPSTPYWY